MTEKREKMEEKRSAIKEMNTVSDVSDIIGIPPSFSVTMPNGFGKEFQNMIEEMGLTIDMVTPSGGSIKVWLELEE